MLNFTLIKIVKNRLVFGIILAGKFISFCSFMIYFIINYKTIASKIFITIFYTLFSKTRPCLSNEEGQNKYY